VLYVYAITDSAQPPGHAGLQGVSPRVIGGRPPFAVVSDHEDVSPEPSEADLWAHERIVEDLMEHSTVLPMRFGSNVADEAQLEAVLDERRREFEAALERVRGAVELGVRARLPAIDMDATVSGHEGGPGRAYLLERAERQRNAADAVARIHEPLASLARRSVQTAGTLDPGVFKGAYLVDRSRVEAFRARVGKLASEVDGARVVCTGPWPPYSFSSGERE
jgi:Gas vesicle synthesis protein GvpL/GvpF